MSLGSLAALSLVSNTCRSPQRQGAACHWIKRRGKFAIGNMLPCSIAACSDVPPRIGFGSICAARQAAAAEH